MTILERLAGAAIAGAFGALLGYIISEFVQDYTWQLTGGGALAFAIIGFAAGRRILHPLDFLELFWWWP